jgi:hypothetical protein
MASVQKALPAGFKPVAPTPLQRASHSRRILAFGLSYAKVMRALSACAKYSEMIQLSMVPSLVFASG